MLHDVKHEGKHRIKRCIFDENVRHAPGNKWLRAVKLAMYLGSGDWAECLPNRGKNFCNAWRYLLNSWQFRLMS